ncbi:hypothetical protein GNI_170560, partial [Gregarina niphandrodes]
AHACSRICSAAVAAKRDHSEMEPAEYFAAAEPPTSAEGFTAKNFTVEDSDAGSW